MQPEKWKNIKSIFSATLDLPESERARFLLGEPDAEIRREVEKLLAAHEKSEKFFEKPLLAEYNFVFEDAEKLIGKRIDDYAILEKIGEGGMGTVFLAEHRGENFTQKVALKLIKRGMDTSAVLKRFLMERQILASLEHPFIARLLDGGTTSDGLPYFVMEHVEGETIKKFCENNSLGARERLELFQKVCRAVAYAHQKLVVHRDLKPSNILVTTDGTPKLLDFGIAKLLAPDWNISTTEATATQMRLMTPEYASPEQLRGKITGVSTDVYSLGVILYELLTGARPFEFHTKNIFEISEKILTSEPALPSSVANSRRFSVSNKKTNGSRKAATDEQKTNQKSKIKNQKSLRGDLDNIILKAIRRQPEERYASVHEFAEDIRRHLAGLPVTATADSRRYRFSKFVSRHRRAAAVTAFVSLLVFSLSALSIYQGINAMRERDKATARFEKLRNVAKLLMTDTRDALGKLPGTLQVQRKLAEKSVDLLASLDDESATDAQFLSELADAYEKLGRMQLWNFREFEKARFSVEHAVEIRRRIVRLEPNNPQRLAEYTGALNQSVEVFQITGEREKVLRLYDEITAIKLEKSKSEPTDENLSALAFHLLGSAPLLKMYGIEEESLRNYEESSRIFDRVSSAYDGRELSPQEKNDLAWLVMLKADALFKLGQDDAFAAYQRSAELAEEAYRADKSLQFSFNHTSRAHRYLGQIYEKQGDFQKAFEMYKFSFDWLKTRENDSSMNRANFYHGQFFFANRCALMLNRLGKKREADSFIAKPYSDYAAFLNAEENAENLIYAREPFLDLTRYFVETDRIENAAEIWGRHFERLQKFLDKNPEDIGFLNSQVEAQNQLGDIYSGYDAQSDSFKTLDAESLKKARSHYEKAAEIYRRSQTIYAATAEEKENLRKIEEKVLKLGKKID